MYFLKNYWNYCLGFLLSFYSGLLFAAITEIADTTALVTEFKSYLDSVDTIGWLVVSLVVALVGFIMLFHIIGLGRKQG